MIAVLCLFLNWNIVFRFGLYLGYLHCGWDDPDVLQILDSLSSRSSRDLVCHLSGYSNLHCSCCTNGCCLLLCAGKTVNSNDKTNKLYSVDTGFLKNLATCFFSHIVSKIIKKWSKPTSCISEVLCCYIQATQTTGFCVSISHLLSLWRNSVRHLCDKGVWASAAFPKAKWGHHWSESQKCLSLDCF